MVIGVQTFIRSEASQYSPSTGILGFPLYFDVFFWKAITSQLLTQDDLYGLSVWSNFRTYSTYLNRQAAGNSVDPDRTLQNSASDQVLNSFLLTRQIYKHLTVVRSTCWREVSRISLSRIPRDFLKHFEISVPRHIRVAEVRKTINWTTTFNNWVCNLTSEVIKVYIK